jgi:DNA end-binding protein Ku
MSTRSIAKVTITLGMFSVGIKLFLSASADRINFNMINTRTGNRVKQKLVDSITEEDVCRGDTIKGYEYQKGKYLTFTDEEISNIQAEKRDTVDVVEFVPVSEIDPVHIEKTYYTGPDKGMDRQYQLLFQVLRNESKAAVGTWTARGKDHLVMIRAWEHGLIVHQMFYNSEVRPFENTCDDVTLSHAEITMGRILIEQFSNDKFDKSKYSDKFSEGLAHAVSIKVSAQDNSSSVADSLRESLVAAGVSKAKVSRAVKKASTKKVAV